MRVPYRNSIARCVNVEDDAMQKLYSVFLKSTRKISHQNSVASKTILNNTKECAGTTNTGGSQKPYNPLKGRRNPIPQKPDNSLKGIQDILQN